MSKSGDVSRVINSIRNKGHHIDEHSCEEGDFCDYDVINLLEEVEDLVPDLNGDKVNVYTWSYNDKILVNFVTDDEITLLDRVKPFLTAENLLGAQSNVTVEFERSKVRIEDASKRKFMETYCCTHPNLIGDLVREAKAILDVKTTEKYIHPEPKVDAKAKFAAMMRAPSPPSCIISDDDVREDIHDLVKQYNRSDRGRRPYISFHWKEMLMITCFTDAPRVRKVVSSVEEAKQFIADVTHLE